MAWNYQKEFVIQIGQNEIEMMHRITEWQLMANGEDKNDDNA